MLFDNAGSLWCATDHGLYRAVGGNDDLLRFELVVDYAPSAQNMAAFADGDGRLWFGVRDALVEVLDGQVIKHSPPEKSYSEITGIVRDTKGRLLVAFGVNGVFEFLAGPDQSRGRWRQFLDPGRYKKVYNPIIDSSGKLWIASREGLIKYSQDDRPELYTTANGLSSNWVYTIAEDREGNLWVGTQGGGVCELMGESIVSYTAADGLSGSSVEKVIEARDGRIYASVSGVGAVEILGPRIEAVSHASHPRIEADNYLIVQDRRGDWWIGTSEGLFLTRGPRLHIGGRKLTKADGLAAGPINRLYEDEAGIMWVRVGDTFYKWDATAGKSVSFEPVSNSFNAVFHDRAGGLWVQTLVGPQIQRWVSEK
jgi:ligand-binding sensor domain-containing protein